MRVRVVSPSVSILRRRVANASWSRSLKTASAAPRAKASKPSAPVPAKASSTAAPAKGRPLAARGPCDRMLNNPSRARSLVGLTASPGGASRRRPRCLPPTIRMGGPFGHCGPELLGERLLRHFGNRPAFEAAELERAIGEPDQARDLKPQLLQHPAYLAVFALGQRHRDPGVAALGALQFGA